MAIKNCLYYFEVPLLILYVKHKHTEEHWIHKDHSNI